MDVVGPGRYNVTLRVVDNHGAVSSPTFTPVVVSWPSLVIQTTGGNFIGTPSGESVPLRVTEGGGDFAFTVSQWQCGVLPCVFSNFVLASLSSAISCLRLCFPSPVHRLLC